MIQKFKDAIAWVSNAYGVASGFISSEPIDIGSLLLGLGGGLLIGGEYAFGLGNLAIGYGLRNKARLKELLASVVA